MVGASLKLCNVTQQIIIIIIIIITTIIIIIIIIINYRKQPYWALQKYFGEY